MPRWYQKKRLRVSRTGKVLTIGVSGNEPAKAHHHGASALKWGTFLRQIPATITIPEQYFINA
ncbi:hypothetical protein [Cronobacter dublinensis]|uniref:hypothetical protein n=1 Tax=Cronobacter dublinensis TaxID=413497 RepID=UPI000CFABAD5|nr:hypothetical protein [Cronobacter dublinensis]ELQ6124599.1 hypothetical protein [Cronobacter dublinensis]